MRSRFLSLLATLIVIGCATPDTVDDPSETHFVKFYGHDGDQTGRDLVVLPDGSMVLFGTSRATEALNGAQWFVTRVDAKGAVMWEREYGGQFDEEARDIALTTSGDIVLVGNSYQADTFRDILVMTLSATDGAALDSALVPTLNVNPPNAPTMGDENASSIVQISDGGFIISGTTTYVNPSNPNPNFPAIATPDSHDALKIRLNADLTTYPNSWKQIYGRYADDGSIAVMEVPSGPAGNFYYYAIGYTNLDQVNTVNYEYVVTPLGLNGDPAAQLFWVGTPSDEQVSSFVFTGSQLFMGGLQTTLTTEFYVASAFLPVDTTGFGSWYLPIQFQKNLTLNLGSALSGHTAVCHAPVNGGFYILSEENSFNNNQNWILSRLNNDGSVAWSAPIVYGGEGFDSAGAVKELSDGRLVIIGTMRTGRPDAGEYKMTLVKVDGEGKFEK